MMNNQNESHLETVLENIEEKLSTLEAQRSELHKQIAVKRAEIQGLMQTIASLSEIEST